MIRRRLLCPLLLAVLSTGWAAEDRTALTAVPYDTISLRNGESLKGSIIERLSNGAVRFQQVGRPANVVERSDIAGIEERQTLAQAVGKRAREALTAGDQIDLLRTIRFALQAQDPPPRKEKERPDEQVPSTAAEVRNAAAEVALLALDRRPTPELAAGVIPLFEAQGKTEAVIIAAERGLVADPNWTLGYETQAKIYLAAKDEGRMKILVKRWLERQPTAFTANRYRAAMAETSGDWRTASECWRKGWDLHQDPPSAVGAIRTLLIRGEPVEALRIATSLKESGKGGDEGNAWLGLALFAQGRDQDAEPLLKAAAKASIAAETQDAVRWDLGLLALREGRDAEAKTWFAKTTQAAVAQAWLDRQPLPANRPAALERLAKDHQTALDLENRRFAPALQTLQGDDRPRGVFLGQVAEILRSQGRPDAINALTATKSPESTRWQAYGHLLAGRDKEAETLLATLPEDDGWALCCRAWLAISRKDDTSARLFIDRLPKARHVPQAYADRLRREFSSSQDEVSIEGFNGDRAYPEGWTVDLGTAGVTVAQEGGLLKISGPLAEGVTTAVWREWPASRLHRIETSVATITGGEAGILLADGARRNGLLVASTLRGPAWRILTAGTWGPWTPLDGATGTTVSITLERGRILAAAGNGAGQEVPAPLGGGASLAVGVAVQADGRGPVNAAFDHLRVQLTPAKDSAK